MKDVYFDIMFPLQGIDTSCDRWQQRYGTTVAAVNVRAYDAGTDRLRGGTRAGLTPFFGAGSTFQVNGFNVVQSLSCIVTAAASAVSAPGSSGPGPVPSGPSISSMSPSAATLAGSVPCVVTGTGFTGATSLTFGTVPAMGWKVTSDTTIHCIMFPVASAGVVTVTVTTPAGTATTPFTFSSLAIVGTNSLISVSALTTTQITEAVCLAEDGNIWGNSGGQLYKLTTGGTVTNYSITLAGSATFLDDLCSGPDGNLWGVDNLTGVYKISLSGVVLATYDVSSTGGTNNEYIRFGPDGNLWITQIGSPDSYVIRMATDGSFSSLTVSGERIVGLCFDRDGNLWVASEANHTICKVSTALTLLGSFVIPSLVGRSIFLAGIDGNGDLWFSYFGATDGFYKASPSSIASGVVYGDSGVIQGPGLPFAGPDGLMYSPNGPYPTGFADPYLTQATLSGTLTDFVVTGTLAISDGILLLGCVGADGAIYVPLISNNPLSVPTLAKFPGT